ncbi:3-deoxy-D-manno-octulosonic acid transferase [Spirochaetota bacterium]
MIFLKAVYILIYPVILLTLFILFLLRRVSWIELLERSGIKGGQKKDKQYIWIHLSSAGEFFTAQHVITELKKIEKNIFLTFSYKDMEKICRESALIDACQYMPLENYDAYKEIIRNYNIKKLIIFETEIWPILVDTAWRKGVPIILMNAYIYHKDFNSYYRFRFLFKNALKKYSYIFVQTELDRKKFVKLGAKEDRIFICGNLKYDVTVRQVDEPKKLHEKYKVSGNSRVLTFASMHSGEEKYVVPVVQDLLSKYEDLFIVIAPRFFESINLLDKELKKENLFFTKRSRMPVKTEEETGNERLLMLDTVGELIEIYAISDLVFVCGSLIPHGGHNVLEPIYFNKHTAIGEYYSNFKNIVTMLKDHGYIDIIKNDELYSYIDSYFSSYTGEKKDNGRAFVKNLAGTGDRIIAKYREINKI